MKKLELNYNGMTLLMPESATPEEIDKYKTAFNEAVAEFEALKKRKQFKVLKGK